MNPSTQSTSTPMRPMRHWKRALPAWLQVSVLLLVFVSGIGVGAVAASQFMLSRMQYYRANPGILPIELSAKLQARMNLSDEQTAKVLAVIQRRHGNIAAIRKASTPGILQEFSQMELEVADLLDPRQREQWHDTAEWARETFLPVDTSAQ